MDSNRLAAVSLAPDIADLKSEIQRVGVQVENVVVPGRPNDVVFLKQAEHFVRAGQYKAALEYIERSLEYNPENIAAMSLMSKCQLLLHNWPLASRAADMVLIRNKKSVKAILVKAEALFNVCQFEHSLVHFFRGQFVSRDKEMTEICRLGVQKCKKIIQDCIPQNGTAFKTDGIEMLYKMLRKMNDMQEWGPEYVPRDKSEAIQLTDIVSMAKVRKKLVHGMKVKKLIKEEEAVAKRNVKTILDKEAAAIEREKLKKTKPGFGNKLNLLSKAAQQAGKTSMMTASVAAKVAQAHANETLSSGKNQRAGNGDRLRQDKAYLNRLVNDFQVRTDISNDRVQKEITKEAHEVLDFLKHREFFWDQLQMGTKRGDVVRPTRRCKSAKV